MAATAPCSTSRRNVSPVPRKKRESSMTSSPETNGAVQHTIDELPPALSSMWRVCKLGFRHERTLMATSFALSVLAGLPSALLALWLALLAGGLLEHDLLRVRVAAVLLALSAAATWLLRTLSNRLSRRFRDRVTVALESHVVGLQATI